MARRPATLNLLRIGAAIVLIAGGACLALQIWNLERITPASLAHPALLFVLCAGVAAVMLAVAGAIGRDTGDLPPEAIRTLSRFQGQIAELSGRLDEIRLTCERIANLQMTSSGEPAGVLSPSDLEPLYQAVREVRELTLLTDSERRVRLERIRQERRATLLRQSFDLVAARRWHEAERIVIAMEAEYPNDHDVSKARDYLNHSRKLNEKEVVAATVREVEELMAISGWDQAYSKSRKLLDGFPDNPEARSLLARVQRERDAFHESTVHRMFDELRHDIERRMWRRALMHAEHLLDRCPQHPRAEGVRKQLKTLRDNAEIEERQELEVRIQELVRSQRFDEAIVLGEDVMRRYPMSPQADSLETLLPRLRELANGGVREFAPLAPEPDTELDIDEEEAQHRLA